MTAHQRAEMPPGVAALRRTPSGIPVSYTVAWTSERDIEIRPDPILASLGYSTTPAIFSSGAPGEGAPKLAATNASRQRRSAVLGLCQVCARPIPEPTPTQPRWLGDLRIAGQTIRLDRVVPLIVDSWTCRPCMCYALHTCPGLLRKPELRLLRVRRYQLVATIERPVSILEESLPYGPIGYVKIAPTDFDVIEPAQFIDVGWGR